VDKRRIKDLVQTQFGAAAQAYVTSPTHAAGDDLRRLLELAKLSGDERVLDVATGGGHTALAFAPHVREVVAVDLTQQMLDAAQAFARSKGATNIRFVRAEAEALPFEDARFEVVVSRIAPHHFADPFAFARESARVLCEGGLFLLDDNMAPADRELDAFMNRFEQWRDPSHVRAYTPPEWAKMLAEAGLEVDVVDPLAPKAYEFAAWVARMRMPEPERDALERWLVAAPQRCKEFFNLKVEDGHVRSICGCFGIIAARKSKERP
jgi:ubiquinone/menaquinone biosynthesis C-methylase UbiE